MTAPKLLESAGQAELYLRGRATLLTSWAAYARGAAGAAVHRPPGVAAAVFPAGPERDVYNNALLERELGPGERASAADAMDAAYAAAGVTRFAAWVHETDEPMRAELERRGYTVDTATRAMGMTLDDIAAADHAALHLLTARAGGELVAAALAYDFGGDCGIYNFETVPKARRRGLGTALTAGQLYAARDRGCRTASLQSTPMAERVYAAVGFRDLGRILEYVPAEGER
jgi:GNAT superfamily N-acetyltransferase